MVAFGIQREMNATVYQQLWLVSKINIRIVLLLPHQLLDLSLKFPNIIVRSRLSLETFLHVSQNKIQQKKNKKTGQMSGLKSKQF